MNDIPSTKDIDPHFETDEEFASWWIGEERRVRQEAIDNGHGPEHTNDTPHPVSLDEYRSEGVSVFAGYERGLAVAKAIKEEYGPGIKVVVPNDVFYLSSHFRAGFHEVLTDVEIPDAV